MKRPVGKIDLLVGQRYAKIFPKEFLIKEDLVLYKSKFGSGWILGGYSKELADDNTHIDPTAYHVSQATVNEQRDGKSDTLKEFEYENNYQPELDVIEMNDGSYIRDES